MVGDVSSNQQRRLQAGPGRVSSHFSTQSGIKRLLEVSGDEDVNPFNAFSGRGGTRQLVAVVQGNEAHSELPGASYRRQVGLAAASNTLDKAG